MRNLITLFLLLFVYNNTTFAQLTSSKFRVNFKVDEYKIDDQDKIILDEIVALSQKTKYCEISLSAHTDNDADDGYNVRLSKNRAQAVTDYLVSKGLNKKAIDIKWFGEKKPELDNKDESTKAVNRRVDIELKQYQFNQLSDLLKTTGGNYTQTFTLTNADQTVIKGKNGTQIIIPKDALVTKDGKPVPAEQVVVELQEFQKPMDAIYNNLTTICDGKILESGGMFKITAKYNGEELVVKKGQSLPVEMPSTNIKPEMELYIGFTNPHQAVEWKQEKTPFEVKRKNPIKAPTTKVNENFLKTLLLPLEGVYTLEAKNVYTLPYIPGKPYTPKYPKKMSNVTEDDLFSATERFFYSKDKKERKINEEQKKRDDIYERRVASYERRMVKYKQDMDVYYQDTITYNRELNKFYSWISDEIVKYEKNIALLEKQLFNTSIKKLISLSENNKLTSMNPQEILLTKFDLDDKNVNSIRTMTYRINVLKWLLEQPIEEINKMKNNDKFNYMAYKVHAAYSKRA
ncbi:MAG: OmpA family protein, partial [Bacteroidetes bacterium]|nr:OmpA family protein [Bacteroidota bacterium]